MSNTPHRLKTISEFHKFWQLPRPQHPLISVVNFTNIKRMQEDEPKSLVNEFYTIALKRSLHAKMRYGQQTYDFDEGIMFCISPGQVFAIQGDRRNYQHSGWMLLIHPDFLWNTPLTQGIKRYEYFSYSSNEALYLSEKEEHTIIGVMRNIESEYQSSIDKFSQDLIIAQLELLLTYADRFYHRQFITRKITNHQILNRLEELLDSYFNNDNLLEKGLPTVQFVADNLNISPSYLSGLLKVLTGQSTQQHIHDHLIEKAKEKLSTTNLSVGEIAYALGFEHPQSFSKLFKTKTKLSPLDFRQSFN
ncbi:AraC-like DNA-binding protein [Pedobacter sp. UYP24]